MQLMEITPSFQMDKLALRLGGRNGRRFSHSTKSKVLTSKAKLNGLVKPRLIYTVKKVKHVEKGMVTLNNEIRFKSPKLSKTLGDSREIICFVATIGRPIEREVGRFLREKRLSEAYILDAVGSVTVEDMVERFQGYMDLRYKKERKASTLRFSPGYCDWSIKEQKKLFAVLDAEQVGIQLTESCLMNPRKSISGVFGISPLDLPRYNPCSDCRKSNCEARRR